MDQRIALTLVLTASVAVAQQRKSSPQELSPCTPPTELQTCRDFTKNFRPFEKLAACDSGFFAVLAMYKGAFVATRLELVDAGSYDQNAPFFDGLDVEKAQTDIFILCSTDSPNAPKTPLVLAAATIARRHARTSKAPAQK